MDALNLPVLPSPLPAVAGGAGSQLAPLPMQPGEPGVASDFGALLAAELMGSGLIAGLALPLAAPAAEQASADAPSAAELPLATDGGTGGTPVLLTVLPEGPAVRQPANEARAANADRPAAQPGTGELRPASGPSLQPLPVANEAAANGPAMLAVAAAPGTADQAFTVARPAQGGLATAAPVGEERAHDPGSAPTHAPTGLMHLQAPAPAVSPGPAVATLAVDAPVGSREFADNLSQQVVWLAGKDAEVAELRLNPPDLGPVEVRLKISGDEATAVFVSQIAEVRSAIEDSLERLRAALAQSGIALGDTSVTAESFRDQGNDGRASAGAGSRSGEAAARDTQDGAAALAREPVRRGLVDLYA